MLYEDGSLRVIVHTGNLIESDWEDRTQGIWVSPSCPPLRDERRSDASSGESPTWFKRDLLRYFEAYSLPCLKPGSREIQQSDTSSIEHRLSYLQSHFCSFFFLIS